MASSNSSKRPRKLLASKMSTMMSGLNAFTDIKILHPILREEITVDMANPIRDTLPERASSWKGHIPGTEEKSSRLVLPLICPIFPNGSWKSNGKPLASRWAWRKALADLLKAKLARIHPAQYCASLDCCGGDRHCLKDPDAPHREARKLVHRCLHYHAPLYGNVWRSLGTQS